MFAVRVQACPFLAQLRDASAVVGAHPLLGLAQEQLLLHPEVPPVVFARPGVVVPTDVVLHTGASVATQLAQANLLHALLRPCLGSALLRPCL